MARSTYVYVVLRYQTPVAGFTVKRELIFWYQKHASENDVVYRLRDNPDYHYNPNNVPDAQLIDIKNMGL